MSKFPRMPIAKPMYYSAFHGLRGLQRSTRAALKSLGLARPVRYLPYLGFGVPERVCVRGRLLVDMGAEPVPGLKGTFKAAYASARRYTTLELSREPCIVQVAGESVGFMTDDHGFLNAWIEPRRPVDPGDIRARILDSEGKPMGETLVHVYSTSAPHGVITDLDDTIIRTNVRSHWARARALFLTDAVVRAPFPDLRELFSRILPHPDCPLFYLSSSPWNIHEPLRSWLHEHELPRGPLMLRDWGLNEAGFAPNGQHDHKVSKVEAIFSAVPTMRFLLVGDDSQQDPEHYTRVALRAPERIKRVLIRRVDPSPTRTATLSFLARRLKERGVPMTTFRDFRDVNEIW